MATAKYEITAQDKTRAALISAKKGLDELKTAAISLKGALAGVSVALVLRKFITESVNAQNEQAQLAAALKSTGEAAGWTQAQLNAMGADFAKNSIFSEGEISTAQARLLSYTGIIGEKVPEAIQAAMDMATRMNMDLAQSAETVGRALDIPSQGLNALSRQGFRFTEEQKKLVGQLERTGRVGEAQAIVLDAMKSSYDGAAKAARNTFGGALTALRNQLNTLMTGSDGSLGEATTAINDLTSVLGSDETKQAFASFTTGLATLVSWTAQAATAVMNATKGVAEYLAKMVHGSADPMERLDTQMKGLQVTANNLKFSIEMANKGSASNKNAILESLQKQLAETEAKIKQVQQAKDGLVGLAPAAPEAPKSNAIKPPTAPVASALPGIDATRALIERQSALLKDALDRQLKDLDQSYEDGLISTAAYFSDRARLQVESLDAEAMRIKAALAEAVKEEGKAAAAIRAAASSNEAQSATSALTRAREQQIQLTGQLTILERDRAAAAATAARDQAQAERELAAQLDQVRLRLMELQGQTAEARKQSLDREYADLLKRLEANGDATGEALVRKLFNVEAARAQLDQMQQQVAVFMEQMNTQEQSINVQRAAGILTESQARQQLVELHQRTSQEVEHLIPLMRELAAATGDPLAIERVKQLEIRLQQMAFVVDDVATRINGSLEDGLSNFLTDFATQTKTAGEAFRDFARGVIAEIAKIASQKLAAELFASFGGGAGGGVGGLISGLLRHSGGLVGAGGQRKRIPGFVFDAAPRYHGGGIAGLAPDEVPAILQKNEEVLTADDPRHRNNGGLNPSAPSGPQSLRFVLVDDRANIGDYLRTADGEQVITEVLQRNAMGMRSIMGG